MTAAHTDRADQRPAADPSVDGLSVSPGQSSAPAEQRGLTTIPASVVGRIAEQVASECTGVGGAAGVALLLILPSFVFWVQNPTSVLTWALMAVGAVVDLVVG